MPEVGDRLVAEIFQRVEVLADQPDIGRIVPEFAQPFLRDLAFPGGRIGIYVSSKAQKEITPAIGRWLSERS